MNKPSYLAVIAISLVATLFTGCAIIELIIDILNYEYTCENGTPRGGTTLDFNNRDYCTTCDNGFIIEGKRCVTEITCSGGTPTSYEDPVIPVGERPIEHCNQCNDGYYLNITPIANTSTTDSRCEEILLTLTIEDGTITANTAQLAVTTSHAATLYWVVYEGHTTTKGSATTISSEAASSSTADVADRSGTGVALEANTPIKITDIDGLSPNSDYRLYAALINTEDDFSLLSDAVDFSTTEVGVPAFTGTPIASDITQTTVNISFTATDSNDTTLNLYWVLYTSEQTELTPAILKNQATGTGGVMRSGSTPDTVNAGTQKSITLGSDASPLTAGTEYYFYALVEDDATPANQRLSNVAEFTIAEFPYVCANGTAVEDTTDSEGVTNCATCNDYFKKDESNNCVATVYFCDNGTEANGSPNAEDDGDVVDKNDDVEKCMSCTNPSDIVHEGACETFSFSMEPAASGATASGTTITTTASHNATLHWVIYASGTTADVTTVVNDVADSSAGLARSGSTGVSLIGEVSKALFIGGSLAAENDYTAYAVITASANNTTRVLSSAIDFTTTASGIPGIYLHPATSNLQKTSTDITFTADEATDLYWVLAISEQTFTEATLKTVAEGSASGDIVAVSGSGVDTEPANIATTISLTSLTPKTTYFFYALLEDTDDNLTASKELKFTTEGHAFVCLNGTPLDDTATSEITNCISCNDYYKLNTDDNSCAQTEYTCSNGTEANGSPNADDDGDVADKNADVEKCMSCNDFFKPDGNSCVSTKYTCSGGDVASGSPNATDDPGVTDTNADVEKCMSCNDFFKPDGSGGCTATQYTCSNGTEANGSPNADDDGDVADKNADVEKCMSCNDFFKPDDSGGCTATQYTCSNGMKATGNPNATDDPSVTDTNADVEKCMSCNDFFKPDGSGGCTETEYFCNGGDVASGSPNEAADGHIVNKNADIENCSMCTGGVLVLNDRRCVDEFNFDGDNLSNDADIDDDNDGLIEIATLEELHNIRHYLEGTSFGGSTAGAPKADNKANNYVCGNNVTGTCGYELVTDLDFDRDGQNDGTYEYNSFSMKFELDTDDTMLPYFDAMNGGWEPIGAVNPGDNNDYSGYFNAVFEGNNHTISGLAMIRNNSNLGLFGAVANGSTIRNLTIDNSLVVINNGEPNEYALGILAGILGYDPEETAVLVDNVDTFGIVIGNNRINSIGGLAGKAVAATISNSSSSASVDNGIGDVGGLIGYLTNGSITASNATGDVKGGGSGDRLGGLVGQQEDGTIHNSYATGSVLGKGSNSTVGGLVGDKQNGTITDSYATGHIKGGEDANHSVGGLVGQNKGGNIIASYATGMEAVISAGKSNSNVGGLVGLHNTGTIRASYSTAAVTGDGGNDNVGGLVGLLDGSGAIIASFTPSGSTLNGVAENDNVGGLVGFLNGNATITASFSGKEVSGGANDNDAVGGLIGRVAGSSNSAVTASYATGVARGGRDNNDFVGGLIGHYSGSTVVRDSYATANIDGGHLSDPPGTDDYGGKLIGFASGSTSIHASYGFGNTDRIDNFDDGIDVIPHNNQTPSSAGDLGANHFNSTAATNAWKFPNSGTPKLQYADYDGDGTDSTYTCTDVTVSYNGNDVLLACTSMTELPGQ